MASQQTFNLLGDPAQYYQLVQQGIHVDPPIDLQSPLAYRDWIGYNLAILPAQRLNKYNEYLQGWYFSYYQTLDTEQQIYQDYTDLVASLIKIFGNDSDLKRVSELDLTDSFQLNIAIPYLSHKLKEIAVYYLQKRSDIKTAKIRYNMIGSNGGIQQIIYNNVLKTFAKGPQTITLDETAWQHIPELSAVNTSFSIEIDELYDENTYLDKNPTVDYGWPASNDSWMYSTGLYQLTSTNPLIFSLSTYIENAGVLFRDQLPPSYFNVGDSTGTLNVYNLAEAGSQFLGTTQYFASGGFTTPQTDEFAIDILPGTNAFYWPWGEFYLESANLFEYQPLKLIDTNFVRDGATGGTTLETSDIIWVNDGNSLSGAWLKDFSNTTVNATMMAELKQDHVTVFKFPFPGYGTTSEKQSWTGKQLTNFEPRSTKGNAIEAQQLYWTDISSVSTSKPISIHDTSLIVCGAKSSNRFFDADKIVVRQNTSDGVHDDAPNLVFNSPTETAWLYRPLYTQLPVKVGETLIYWPYFTGEDAKNPAFQIGNYAANIIMLSATDSTIAFRGAVAGQTPETSDIIEMVDCDNVVMRAWLSGCDVKLALPEQYRWGLGTVQPGLNLNLASGKWTYFVYDAPDRAPIPITQVNSFVGYNHEADCPYLLADKKSLTNARLGVDDTGCDTWKKCTCKAVYYTPFGHSGAVYDDNHRMADVIMVDTQYPAPPNISTWKGRDGRPFRHSRDFAWFSTSTNPEPDVGWGRGFWKTKSGAPFRLEPGVRYVYYRTPVCCGTEGPPLIVSHSYCDCGGSKNIDAGACSICINPYLYIKTCDCDAPPVDYCCRPVWIGMAKRKGKWVSTNAHSNMPLIPGQKYRFHHRPETTYTWADTSSEVVVNHTITVDSIDFLITQQLSGWSDNAMEHCQTCPGAYPYWASSTNQKGKGLNCNTSIAPSSPAPYLLVTNPRPSRISLTSDLYMEYHHTNDLTFVWAQPVVLNVYDPKVQWCHIEIDPAHVDPIITDMHISNCSDCAVSLIRTQGACACTDVAEVQLNSGCNAHRITVSATDTLSEIVLNGKTLCSDYTTISYCAIKPFSTSHELVNLTVPSVYSPVVTGLMASPTAPWANLANRHFPTVATIANVLTLSSADQYGLLNPNDHGTLTYVGERYSNQIALQGELLPALIPIVEPSVWNNSRGLTQTDNNPLVSTLSNDASWMKASIFSGTAGGSILHGDRYQTFVPYQTHEQVRQTHNGFRTSKQTMWDDLPAQTPDFHNYYDVEQWNTSQPTITGTMTNWATDLFGNQYMLVKDRTSAYSIEQQRSSNTGTLWVRTINDDILPATTAMESMYSKYLALSSSVYNQLVDGKITDLQLFGNTMMIVLSSHILLEKIDYDFDNQQILASDDATVIYEFAPGKSVGSVTAANVLHNYNYGGHWYDPSHNKLLILTSAHASLTSLPYINIHSLDTYNHKFSMLYPQTSADVAVWSEADASLAFGSYPVDVNSNPWVVMSGRPSTTVNSDTNQLICHYLLNMHTVPTKHDFVTATWQLSPSRDNVILKSIDVKRSLV